MTTRSDLLPTLPAKLRDELFDTFDEIERNFRECRWEPSELNGGKLCEVTYSILKGHLDGSIPEKAVKPRNMAQACRELECYPSDFPKSVRVQLPRILVALYEIRNNRNVGHIGGDVDPNYMDAMCVLHMAKWVLCELIRIFHQLSIDEARLVVEATSQRSVPVVWQIDDRLRVLRPSMTFKDKVLALLYSKPGGIEAADLFIHVEHKHKSNFLRDVLQKLHDRSLIDFNRSTGKCIISPIGILDVENRLL
ncbi:MAG: hypothetical protein GC188_10875 [Alphaproteobacteria bacterium]|nr:hypothetical protein [Alphaproteobacteria bacterium]